MPRQLDHSKGWFKRRFYYPSPSQMAAFDQMVRIHQEEEAGRAFFQAQQAELEGRVPSSGTEIPSSVTPSVPQHGQEGLNLMHTLNPDIPSRHNLEG